MSVKDVIKEQYRNIVNKSAHECNNLPLPSEGWIKTVRKSLGLSGADLARKIGKSRSEINRIEKSELDGIITIKTIRKIAKTMNCKFVYAIIPNTSIENILYNQAIKKAEKIVKTTSVHMAFEQQALSEQQIREEIEKIAQEILINPPSDFWKDNI